MGLYLSPAELVNAATGVDWKSIPATGASSAAQVQEQTNIIRRASNWIDGFCQQPLSATQQVSPPRRIDGDRVRALAGGGFYMLLDQFPIVSVSLVEWSPDGITWNTIVPPYIAIIPTQQSIQVLPNGTVTLLGTGWGYGAGWLRATYIAGYANALLTGNVSANATTIPVDDRTGITPGQSLTFCDSITGTTVQEIVTVASTYVPAMGAGNVTLATGVVNAHLAGARLSALPALVGESTILISTSYARARGRSAIAVNQVGGGRTTRNAALAGDEFARAREALQSYKAWQ